MANDQTYPVRTNLNLLGQTIESLDPTGNLSIGGSLVQNTNATVQAAAAGVAASTFPSAQGPIVQEFILTAANLLALRATPIQLVPAPGAGKFIKVLGVDLKLVFNSAAYTNNANANLKIFHGTTANAKALTAELDAILLLVADSNTLDVPTLVVSGAKALMENVGIFAGNDGTQEYATGDSPLKVIVTYIIVTP